MEKPALDAVAAVSSSAAPRLSATLRGAATSPAQGFAEALAQALEGVNESQVEAARTAQRFQSGDPAVTLEDTMLAMQKANLSFQAIVQVRNRLLAAYQDIMNMQV